MLGVAPNLAEAQDLDSLLKALRKGRTEMVKRYIPVREIVEWNRQRFAQSYDYMMGYMKERGKYPTISITGAACALNCDHCQRQILKTMTAATTPESLIEACKRMNDDGDIGVLISGGSRKDGTLAWDDFFDAISTIKKETDLRVTNARCTCGSSCTAVPV